MSYETGTEDLLASVVDGVLTLTLNRPAARNALSRAKALGGHMRVIEIEVDTLQQLAEALPLAPNCILLDNMSLDQMREAVAMTAGRAILEASGKVRLETVRDIAMTGVNVISVGALTHSARRLDLGLDVT